MLRSKVANLTAIGLAMALCASARGQFQEPTKEELQMAADPKAPGANAVYLTFSDDEENASAIRTYYERVKVLTEKGKERATLRFSHDPNTKFEVEGRTIHKDGTIVPLTDKPSDLMGFKTKDEQLNSLVFTLPAVEVGSILEYRVKFKYPFLPPFPTWNVQQDIFVHKAHYSFKPGVFGSQQYIQRLGGDAKVVDNRKTRSLVYSYTILNAKEYAGLHDFYQKVATADQQQITLTKGAAASGN